MSLEWGVFSMITNSGIIKNNKLEFIKTKHCYSVKSTVKMIKKTKNKKQQQSTGWAKIVSI